MICELYGFTHKTAKKILRGSKFPEEEYEFIDLSRAGDNEKYNVVFDSNAKRVFINDIFYSEVATSVDRSVLFPVENVLPKNSKILSQFKDGNYPSLKASGDSCSEIWMNFLLNSKIGRGWKNEGFHYAGYIKERNTWCLPSWIWTNAAIVRCFCASGMLDQAKQLCELFLEKQLDCGGWVVRYDYDKEGILPNIAPNDSAYIAANALLEIYQITKEKKYLDTAEKVAEWIMGSALANGMVPLGFDPRNNRWIDEYNIVDTGFTGVLFSRLYKITMEDKYLIFLERFINAYIKTFYISEKKSFATAINAQGNKIGGVFGRGQGWALEGLIAAYECLGLEHLRDIIDSMMEFLIKNQHPSGAWPYNFQKVLMGYDCKGIPVLAYNMLKWYKLTGRSNERILKSVLLAMKWCKKHTQMTGESSGGIFSYTIEGAVVHNLYTSTAFVYSSAYAIETAQMLKEEGYEIDNT